MTDFKDQISLMIPAYLRGDLSRDDVATVQKAAAADPEIAADLTFQRSLRETLQSDKTHGTSDELGWARLSRAMDSLETDTVLAPVDAPLAANDAPKKQSRIWMAATAALAVIAIGQLGVMTQTYLGDDKDARYELVTEAMPEVMAGSVTKAAPRSDVTIKAFGDLLIKVEGQIISGPSAIGLYDLKFKTKAACETALPLIKLTSDSVSNCSL